MTRTPRTCHELGVCNGRKGVRLAPWQRLVLGACGLLLASGLLGFAAGVLHAKGWPL